MYISSSLQYDVTRFDLMSCSAVAAIAAMFLINRICAKICTQYIQRALNLATQTMASDTLIEISRGLRSQ